MTDHSQPRPLVALHTYLTRLVEGKLCGRGVYTASAYTFDGEWRDDKPGGLRAAEAGGAVGGSASTRSSK